MLTYGKTGEIIRDAQRLGRARGDPFLRWADPAALERDARRFHDDRNRLLPEPRLIGLHDCVDLALHLVALRHDDLDALALFLDDCFRLLVAPLPERVVDAEPFRKTRRDLGLNERIPIALT